jgi:hypothetical protein
VKLNRSDEILQKYNSVDFQVGKIMAVETMQSETRTMLEELRKEIREEIKKEFVKGEREKMDNIDDYLVLQVRFPNSNTNYEYLIDKTFLQSELYYNWNEDINKEYFIVNEFGYAYSSPIRIVAKPYPYTSSSAATKKILRISERYGNLCHTDNILYWEKSAETLNTAFRNLENAKKAYNKLTKQTICMKPLWTNRQCPEWVKIQLKNLIIKEKIL